MSKLKAPLLAIEKAEMVDGLTDLLKCEWFEIYSKVCLLLEAGPPPLKNKDMLQVDDIDVVEIEEPLQAKMAGILSLQLESAKLGDPYNHGLYNGMLYMAVEHDGGEYNPIGKRDFYPRPSAVELQAAKICMPEPFGYFRCDGVSWHHCHEDDEGAIPLALQW